MEPGPSCLIDPPSRPGVGAFVRDRRLHELLVGAPARLWLERSRGFIVPLTVLAGRQPAVRLSITKTKHPGRLLYSSPVQFTPDEPKAIPRFGPAQAQTTG